MRFLIYGDLQAADGHERCFNNPSMPLQRWRVNTFMAFVRETYDKYGCDGLIDLGDTTDDRQAIPIPTIHSVLTPLSRFWGKQNIKLIGNHEQWLRSTEMDPGVMYKGIFNVVKSHDVIDFKCGVVFACVSYIDDKDELKKAVAETVKKAKNIAGIGRKVVLLGHFSVQEALAHNLTLQDGLCPDDIPKVDAAFLGHIHKHQQFKPNHFWA